MKFEIEATEADDRRNIKVNTILIGDRFDMAFAIDQLMLKEPIIKTYLYEIMLERITGTLSAAIKSEQLGEAMAEMIRESEK
jgi:hypothetical protein